MDYLRSRIKKKWSDSESTDDEGSVDGTGDEIDVNIKKSKHDPVGGPDVSEGNDDVLEPGRLYIRNIPYSATEEELEEHFSKYGTVSQVHIVIDKETRSVMGYGFVLFAVPESAARALEDTEGSSFQGRVLHVEPAKQRYQSDAPETINASKTLKQKRNGERKASEASGNTRAWNTLFMRADTIVENIARKLGVSKSEFLDRESDDLAVRIALGEAQVIAETKKALSSAGVNISALEEFATGKTGARKRSSPVILSKKITLLFMKGSCQRCLGGLAAWTKSFYLLLKPWLWLYFLNLLKLLQLSWIKIQAVQLRSLYIKNLNFNTSDGSVKSHFAEHVKGGKILSAKLSCSGWDGHALRLQLCDAKKDETLTKKNENDRSSTKFIVKNVAFEATEKDLRQLFNPFGQIERLKLPKKFGNHRGFAFVEFVTEQEARNALEALSTTHLYGRRLVFERAKEGESLEELRARTAAQFTDSAKLSKKRKQLAILNQGDVKLAE
ncbi:hypothetical protein CASFOL_019751 [Castilleja foliolosa]|uniref:RRM domain-containing protein n=1 Tax=Castilleja foliolosa TaxID=1961234 RepID=A0ABD3D075_9LAMI